MNFVCVYHVNEKTVYDKEYVNKLYRAIKRNYQGKINFYCLSNAIVDVDTIQLKNDWPGWWSKIELFRKNLFDGPVLYLDLDVIILDSIDIVLQNVDYKNFYMIKSVTPESGNANSSIMSWEGDYSFIYDNFLENKDVIMSRYQKGNLIGDQAYIQSVLSNLKFLDEIDENLIKWNHWSINQKVDVINPKFYIFCGKSKKPHLNLNDPIITKHWL